MTTGHIIIQKFCFVEDAMKDVAKVCPSAVVVSKRTRPISLLSALKGEHFRIFYRWLKRTYDHLFIRSSDFTGLKRLLSMHQDWRRKRFLAGEDASICFLKHDQTIFSDNKLFSKPPFSKRSSLLRLDFRTG